MRNIIDNNGIELTTCTNPAQKISGANSKQTRAGKCHIDTAVEYRQ